jgi:hypothetical protein
MLVVVPSVGELFLEAFADKEAVVGIDGQVAGIEEGVEIRAKKESIADLMTSPVRVGSDVGSL